MANLTFIQALARTAKHVYDAVIIKMSSVLESYVEKEAGKGLSTNDYTTTEKNKLAGIASGAEKNTIKSIKLNGSALTPDSGKAVNIDLSSYSTKTETDTAINNKLSGVYKLQGSINFSELPTTGMKVGYTYNIKDDFTTTASFVEGAGKKYPAGTNVSYTDNGWDCLAGIYDFSEYLKAADVVDITEEEINDICIIS